MRDYIKATVGFEKLGAATGAPPKSLIRMFGPRGNPQAKNLFSVGPSWPDLFRPSTTCFLRGRKTWMPATSAGMTRRKGPRRHFTAGKFSA